MAKIALLALLSSLLGLTLAQNFQLIKTDEFDEFDTEFWQHEYFLLFFLLKLFLYSCSNCIYFSFLKKRMTLGGGGNWEFQMVFFFFFFFFF